MINYLQIIGLICIAILWVYAEPTVELRRLLGFDEADYKKYSAFKQAVHRLMNCVMCSAFWIALPITGSFYMAAIISVAAEILTRIMAKLI